MDKKQIKFSRKMDMEQFLRSYCAIDNEDLIYALSKLTHKQLKPLARSYGIKLSSVRFEDVEIEDINTGEIILVNDCFNRPAPYKNPNMFLEFMDDYYEEDKNDKHKRR